MRRGGGDPPPNRPPPHHHPPPATPPPPPAGSVEVGGGRAPPATMRPPRSRLPPAATTPGRRTRARLGAVVSRPEDQAGLSRIFADGKQVLACAGRRCPVRHQESRTGRRRSRPVQ